MTALPRPVMAPNSPRCYCPTCGAMFLTHVSFDWHRGIVASDDELHEDRGTCSQLWELQIMLTEYEPGVWGNADETATADRFKAMREVRAGNGNKG